MIFTVGAVTSGQIKAVSPPVSGTTLASGTTWRVLLLAMRRGSGDRYGQNASGKLVAEGVEARVPYRGRLTEMIFQLIGGLRSGMGYVGAHNLEELREKAEFVRITPGGLRESHTHDIVVTEEPVNYQSMEG